MANPTNNIPVEDDTTTSGALPGATIKLPAGKNTIGVPNVGAMDAASTQSILENMQRFVDERQGPFNKVMRGLNLGYATTYGPEQARLTQASQEAEDVQTQNAIQNMAAIRASLAKNQNRAAYLNTPQGSTVPATGGPGVAPVQGGGETPIQQIMAGLPPSLKSQAMSYYNQGDYDSIFSLAKEYEIKGKPGDIKTWEAINAMPEGQNKEMLKRQHLEKAYAPIVTYEGGFEKKTTPPWAGVPGAASAPTDTTGNISSPFGARALPGAKPGMHGGIDLPLAKGAPINSFTQGTVQFAGNANDGYGNKIVVKNADGTTSIYAHLDSLNVKPGDSINRNSPLGAAGQTGKATGSHLHFEVRDASGNPIDPNQYFTGKTATTTTTGGGGGVPAGTSAAAETTTKNLQSQNEAVQKEIISPLLAETKKDVLSVPQIDRALETLNDPNTKVGPGSSIQQTLLKTKGIFTQLPPDQLRELTNSRIMDQASKRRVTDGIKTALGGQLSDSDVKFVTDAMFTIDDPKQFIKATLEIERANAAVRKDMLGALTHSRAMDKQEAYNEYVQSGRGLQILKEKAPSVFASIDKKKPANAPSAATTTAPTQTIDFTTLQKRKP